MFNKQYFSPQYFAGQFFSPTSEIEETKRSGVARLALYLLQEEDIRRRRERDAVEKAPTPPEKKPTNTPVVVTLPRKKTPAKRSVVRVEALAEKEQPRPPSRLKPLYMPRVVEQNERIMTAVTHIAATTELDLRMREVELQSAEEDDELFMMLLAA